MIVNNLIKTKFLFLELKRSVLEPVFKENYIAVFCQFLYALHLSGFLSSENSIDGLVFECENS